MEKESPTNQSPLILSRTFLKIVRTKIDVYESTLSMEFGDSWQHSSEDHAVFKMKLFEFLVQEAMPEIINKQPFT